MIRVRSGLGGVREGNPTKMLRLRLLGEQPLGPGLC